MKLYELIELSKEDYDTYDTDIDASVTVCYIGKETDDCEKFCNDIMRKVEVKEIHKDYLIVDWSKLITDNMEKFKAFTEKHWRYKYRDDEAEFLYQWINEIHLYMAGYVSEDFYTTLVEFVGTLEA